MSPVGSKTLHEQQQNVAPSSLPGWSGAIIGGYVGHHCMTEKWLERGLHSHLRYQLPKGILLKSAAIGFFAEHGFNYTADKRTIQVNPLIKVGIGGLLLGQMYAKSLVMHERTYHQTLDHLYEAPRDHMRCYSRHLAPAGAVCAIVCYKALEILRNTANS